MTQIVVMPLDAVPNGLEGVLEYILTQPNQIVQFDVKELHHLVYILAKNHGFSWYQIWTGGGNNFDIYYKRVGTHGLVVLEWAIVEKELYMYYYDEYGEGMVEARESVKGYGMDVPFPLDKANDAGENQWGFLGFYLFQMLFDHRK